MSSGLCQVVCSYNQHLCVPFFQLPELLAFLQSLHKLICRYLRYPSVALCSSQLPFQSHPWDCSWSLGCLGASLGSSELQWGREGRCPRLNCAYGEHRGTDKCSNFHGTAAAGRMWHSSAETGNQELPGLGGQIQDFLSSPRPPRNVSSRGNVWQLSHSHQTPHGEKFNVSTVG